MRAAEKSALMDTTQFIPRAREIYGIPHFVCDSGGSICEVVEPEDPQDPILKELSSKLLMVWIEGSEAHTDELVRRFDRAPKPMYYQPEFLEKAWVKYRVERGLNGDEVNPDDFVRWTYAQALNHRQPRYAAMARNWGVTLKAEEVATVRDHVDLTQLIAAALDRRMP